LGPNHDSELFAPHAALSANEFHQALPEGTSGLPSQPRIQSSEVDALLARPIQSQPVKIPRNPVKPLLLPPQALELWRVGAPSFLVDSKLTIPLPYAISFHTNFLTCLSQYNHADAPPAPQNRAKQTPLSK
jgi:hypothetical protein